MATHETEQDPAAELVLTADLADPPTPTGTSPETPAPRRRRVILPIVLFVLTCGSTFVAGSLQWMPQLYLLPPEMLGKNMFLDSRLSILNHWQDGLIYMLCLLAILFFHEMGHFIATLIYRIPASLPYFIPFPISPLGTFGAVIGMDGMRADRKEIFDIGLAGPLAGLAICIPIMYVGVQQLELSEVPQGPYGIDLPLAVRWSLDVVQPEGYRPGKPITINHVNPFFMAGWVGLLVTGLNMVPASQLDGGHVTYTLFGKSAHWIGRGFMILAVAYIVYSGSQLWLMAFLVMMLGNHPPTRDDSVPLGWFRVILGLVSLTIPFLCLAPRILYEVEY